MSQYGVECEGFQLQKSSQNKFMVLLQSSVGTKDWEAAVVEEFGEGLLIVLLEFVVLVEKFLFFFFVLEL